MADGWLPRSGPPPAQVTRLSPDHRTTWLASPVFRNVLCARADLGLGFGRFGAAEFGTSPFEDDELWAEDARGARAGAACAVDMLLADALFDDDRDRMPLVALRALTDDAILNAPAPLAAADTDRPRAALERAAYEACMPML